MLCALSTSVEASLCFLAIRHRQYISFVRFTLIRFCPRLDSTHNSLLTNFPMPGLHHPQPMPQYIAQTRHRRALESCETDSIQIPVNPRLRTIAHPCTTITLYQLRKEEFDLVFCVVVGGGKVQPRLVLSGFVEWVQKWALEVLAPKLSHSGIVFEAVANGGRQIPSVGIYMPGRLQRCA